ncbi:MAG: hypothetical protein CM1200mP29_06730 [Verrucomicrobiota bacterium]|nr:MAG: hypothetical protein CM1200mP29_06730 [Verrucomicrobiota bacterium]
MLGRQGRVGQGQGRGGGCARPGAFEIPAVASALAKRLAKPVDASFAWHILRGETTHAEIWVKRLLPLWRGSDRTFLAGIHEVLLLKTGNRGPGAVSTHNTTWHRGRPDSRRDDARHAAGRG